MLTELRCRSAKGKERPYKLADSKGLHLYVTPSGYRSWRWKYRHGGKEKRLVFGPYPEVSLAEARQKREDSARLLRAGTDPALDRRQREAVRALDAENTFEAVALQWHENQRATWTPKHSEKVLASLKTEVFPALGKLPIRTITAPLVLQTLQAVEKRGARERAHRVRQRMSAVFGFAIAAGVAEMDPAAAVQRALKPLIKSRQPALLKLDEARGLLRQAEEAPAHPLTKLASRLLALTAVRSGVLRLAEPSEFHDLEGEDPRWIIPAEKMKLELEKKEDRAFDFTVPLARQSADAVLAALRLIGRGPYLFPSVRNAHRPMSENTIGYMYNRLPGIRGRHVPHGWRSTFSTIMNERAVRLERPGDRPIIDLMLAHVQQGIEPIYNRAAYMPRRRQLAQEWADLLMEGLPPAEQLLEGPRK